MHFFLRGATGVLRESALRANPWCAGAGWFWRGSRRARGPVFPRVVFAAVRVNESASCFARLADEVTSLSKFLHRLFMDTHACLTNL